MEEKEFLNYVKDGYKLIPLKEQIPIENIDPLQLYKSLSDKPKSYFFESLEGEKKWSRYTILGLPSNDYLDVFGNEISLYEEGKKTKNIKTEDPINWIEDFHSQFKVLHDKDLPNFQGGLVGFFGFDTVQFIEPKLSIPKQKDSLATPDISLIISREILIFDKTKNLIHIIVYADNTIISFKEKTDRLREIQEILKKFCVEKIYFSQQSLTSMKN